MFQYRTPLRDIHFVHHELLDASAAFSAMDPAPAWDAATIDQVVEEAGRFAEAELAPLNAAGDAEACHLVEGVVKTPKGFAQAYRRFVDSSWPTLACDPEFGGQGAPTLIYSAMLELLYAANPGWTMYFGTAHAAYQCLRAHASPEQKNLLLPPIASGRWTATMCITEPHCGSDLSLIRSRAVPHADGSYRITATKMFISGGDQDITENIVHLVLARLPDAPAGVAGISLFAVPKFLPQGSGLSERVNGVSAGAVEHKMGLRGSATCLLNFDGAVGWLVGLPNEGLRNMFVMINSSRVGVAVQGLGMGQAAYTSALAYARERLQMRAAAGARRPDLPADPIIEHADVRRMLLTQKAHVEAARMLIYWLSLLLDQQAIGADASARRDASRLVDLLTPVAKAFLTENAFTVANLAIQVHGGHGYIRDQGVEQIVRDVRVASIYEGTNGIQARDLLARKVLADGGAGLRALLGRIRGDARADEAEQQPAERSTRRPPQPPARFAGPLLRLCNEAERLVVDIGCASRASPDEVGACAWDFLRALGHLVSAWLFARAAAVAQRRLDEGSQDPFYGAKLATADFYFARILPEADMHLKVAESGLASLSELPEDRLFFQ